MAKTSPGPLAAETPAPALPVVRLEVRPANGRPTLYEVGDGGFLVGSVPGCDLRLPGSNLAPVLCLISRHAGGASLRKLAPVQPILVNGKQVASTYLANGDRLTLGPVEMLLTITAAANQPAPASAVPIPAQAPGVNVDDRLPQLQAREKQLRAQYDQLQGEQAQWASERRELEAECLRQKKQLEEASQNLRRIEADLRAREQAWQAGQEELARQRQELEGKGDETNKQQIEVATLRKELGQIRQQLYQRYHDKRDHLIKLQQAVRRAAQRVLERKRKVDAETGRVEEALRQCAEKEAGQEAGSEQLQRERQLLDDQLRLIASRQQEIQRELAERLNDIQPRERQVEESRTALAKGQQQHQADLVRLDRIQATLEQRQKQMQTQALEVDRRFEHLQRDSRDLEEQAAQLDDSHKKLAAETEQLVQQKREQETETAKLNQRVAAVESQQAMLATLRTRLERMREELHRQEETLSDQRTLQEATETDLRQRVEDNRKLRTELDNEKELSAQERRRFEERHAIMESAVTQLRQAQEALTAEQTQLEERQKVLDATAAEQAEQAGLLLARGGQLEEIQTRYSTDRQALKEREATLTRSELAVTALQEQLRRRAEELSERQKSLAEQEEKTKKHAEQLATEARLTDNEHQLAAERLESLRQELLARSADLDRRQQDLQRLQEDLRGAQREREQTEQVLTKQRQNLDSDRLAWEVEKMTTGDALAAARGELETDRNAARMLTQQLPDLESRVAAALDRLLRAREQMREQLAEVHTYGKESRDDLEAARQQVQTEADRVRQQDLALNLARDEHRLAVAAYRQQLIEWQGQVGEMKQMLLQNASQLDRRQAEVNQKAQEIETAGARLAEQAEQLQHKERQVEEKRGEMDRHLTDMREWYRRKLRELAGVDIPDRELPEPPAEGQVVTLPVPAAGEEPRGEDSGPPAGERDILSLTGDLDPGDRQLGDLLRSLELVDADTLTALLLEARRQRRSLRQLLLAGNYLTLYQMALIEAGNLDALVLGPVRIIDRLQTTSHEVVYRVFDPRCNAEAILRHLAEAEMQDAVHPDEFRQRFGAAAAVKHVHLAATLEVLEIAGRPAVLQECLTGLPSNDWPALASAPGVWYRLLAQAALALQTAHAGGLMHGHLQPSSFVFTADGTLKLLGLGEPRWLAAPLETAAGEPSAEADLHELGRIAAGWAAMTPSKGGKAKALPRSLQALLQHLQAEDPEQRFPNASALLEELDAAGADVPANAAAWERFVKEVREQAASLALRRSA